MKYALPILSALFLVYGILYSTVYYRSFGIRAQDFFSIEDYLRANVANIASFLLPVVLGLVMGMVMNRKSPANDEARIAARQERNTQAGIACVLLAAIATFFAARHEYDSAVSALASVAVLVWMEFSWDWLPTSILDPLLNKSVWLALVVTDVVPATLIWNTVGAMISAERVRTQRPAEHMYVQFMDDVAGPATAAPPDSLVVIGINSNYCFLYERGASRTHVVPTRYIMQISVGPRGDAHTSH